MYWSDIYSSNVNEKLMREEQAVRNIEHRMRANRAGRYTAKCKPTIRKVPNRKKAPVIALPALSQKLIIATAALFMTMFVAVSFSFASTNGNTTLMPEARNDIMQEEAVQTEEIAEEANSDNADSELVQEPIDESTAAESTVAMTEEIGTEPVAEDNSSENSPALTVSEISHDVDHTPIWQNVTAYDFTLLDLDERVDMIGAMAHDDELATGIPAELTAAQMILESGWMESGLTQEANNCFGIKASSGGYNWDNSTWDGFSVAEMETEEEYEIGEITTIVDGFRVYNSVWDSVCDHSAYLLNSGLYSGIADRNKNLDEVLTILTNGGYATGSDYASEVKNLIETYDLTRFGC